MSDVEERLRDALQDLAPTDLSTQSLATGAWRRHERERRRRLVVGAAAAVVILAGAGVVVGSLERPAREVPAGPRLTPGDCTTIAQPAGDGGTTRVDPTPGASESAAWICPDPSAPAAGDGWQLPVVPLTGRYAQTLVLPDRTSSIPEGTPGAKGPESSCDSVRPGPGFTLTVQGEDGSSTTYRSTDDWCGGATILTSFLMASADQEADARASTASDEDLACRSDQAWVDGPHGTSLNSPLVTATMCFAPNYQLSEPLSFIQPMVPRSYQSAPVPREALTLLNRDMASVRNNYAGNGECIGEGAWTYSVIGRTESGQYRRLRSACLDEFFVSGADRVGFNVSPDTTAGLQALAPPS